MNNEDSQYSNLTRRQIQGKRYRYKVRGTVSTRVLRSPAAADDENDNVGLRNYSTMNVLWVVAQFDYGRDTD